MRRKVLVLALLCASIALPVSDAQAYSNGNIPASARARIVLTQPCATLIKPAAASYNTLQLSVRRTLPTNGCLSSYRTYAQQVQMRQVWCALGRCGNAAWPGTSNHGWGLAVDIPPFVRSIIDRFGRPFGWCKCTSDAQWESWHIRWAAGVWPQRPDPGPDFRSPVLQRHSGGVGQRGAVKQLQVRLNRWREGKPRLKLNGEFSAKMRGRVKHFQADHRLSTTGLVGSKTWKALRTSPQAKALKRSAHVATLATKKLSKLGRQKAQVASLRDKYHRRDAYAKKQHGAKRVKWLALRKRTRKLYIRAKVTLAKMVAARVRVAHINDAGLRLVASFEGLWHTAYNDGATAAGGYCTIGLGHLLHYSLCTSADRHLYWSTAKAYQVLRADLRSTEFAVLAGLHERVTANEFSALVSLGFNIGTGGLRASTLMRYLNAGHHRAAADQFLVWDKAGGRVLLGLHRRRVAERALFLR